MHSYSPAEWTSFLVAIVGAAAALTGLLFVAVSINLDRLGPRSSSAGRTPTPRCSGR